MQKGITLVEVMISMAIASILILTAYGVHAMGQDASRGIREGWYCMQSLRAAIIQLDRDLLQCGYLLPADMKIALRDSELFVAGVPLTSEYAGLDLADGDPPPYYAVVVAQTSSSVQLDTVDLDRDHVTDFWADLGLITDKGPMVIGHTYARGNIFIPVDNLPSAMIGSRVVPAIHYALGEGGLYRNGQILAERIDHFEAHTEGSMLDIYLRARCQGVVREMHYGYPIE